MYVIMNLIQKVKFWYVYLSFNHTLISKRDKLHELVIFLVNKTSNIDSCIEKYCNSKLGIFSNWKLKPHSD